MHNSVTYLNRTPIFEWWVVRCRSMNRHQEGMCLKGLGLHAQTLLTILTQKVNMSLLGCFLAPAFLTLKNHSSKMGARKHVFYELFKSQLCIQEES